MQNEDEGGEDEGDESAQEEWSADAIGAAGSEDGPPQVVDLVGGADDRDDASDADARVSGSMECPQCTFVNSRDASRLRCRACRSPLPGVVGTILSRHSAAREEVYKRKKSSTSQPTMKRPSGTASAACSGETDDRGSKLVECLNCTFTNPRVSRCMACGNALPGEPIFEFGWLLLHVFQIIYFPRQGLSQFNRGKTAILPCRVRESVR